MLLIQSSTKNSNNLFLFSQIEKTIESITDKQNVTKEFLNKLQREGYLEIIYTERRLEPYVFIVLSKKAQDYLSERIVRKKELFFRLALALLSAVVTFFLGKILYAIFS